MFVFDSKPRARIAPPQPAAKRRRRMVDIELHQGVSSEIDAHTEDALHEEVAEPVASGRADFSRTPVRTSPALQRGWLNPMPRIEPLCELPHGEPLLPTPCEGPAPWQQQMAGTTTDPVSFKLRDGNVERQRHGESQRHSERELARDVDNDSERAPPPPPLRIDEQREHETLNVVEQLAVQLKLDRPLQLRIDGEAERELAGRSSRGAARGDRVFIRPRGFDPQSRDGRRVLAHELAHVAQSRLASPDVISIGAAEAEASSMADAFVEGRPMRAPRAHLPAAITAYDDGADRAREDEILKAPKTFKMSISYSGIEFIPDPANQTWAGNIERRIQAFAAMTKVMVGTNYSVALMRECRAWLESNGGIEWINIPQRPALQDEALDNIVMRASLANNMVKYFTTVHQPPVQLRLAAKQIAMLRTLEDISTLYAKLKGRGSILYTWYTEYIFKRVMFNNRKLLDEFLAAGEDDDKFTAAELHRDQTVVPYEKAVSAVRRDPVLTDEPGYRALWNMPAKTPGDTTKPPPVGPETEINGNLGAEFLLDMQAHFSVDDISRVPSDAAFRKAVFNDWARRMQLRKIDLEGDVELRDAPGKAVQPADPAAMFSHPALEAPYYDRQAGSEMLFWMNVYTANMWEHFRTWHYKWEVIRVPHDDWSKRDDAGKNPDLQGEDYGGFGSILSSRLRRNLSNAEVDIKRSFWHIENVLGPPGLSRVGLQVGSSALSAVGSVIKTVFGKFTERPWEHTEAIKEDGVYVVRCTATRRDDESSLIRKLPSSAYLPIWVRPAKDIVTDRVSVDNVMAQVSKDRLTAILAKLSNKTEPPTEAERKALEDEARDLKGALYGDADTQLNVELRKLNKIKNDATEWARLSKLEQAELDKRVDDINFILKKRSDWITDMSGGSTGTAEKLNAYFITQEGPSANRPMRLLLEVVELKAPKGMFRYAVLDNTTRDGEHREGPARSTKSDAISDAIVELLEDVGYGRGMVTVAIPKGIWDVGAKDGEIRTIPIQRSNKMLFLEGLENLALVASIAAIAAAPFTGGESLALLVPIGVIGAIPSAYRIAHRVSESTFEWDMATVMDVMNCLGAVALLGQFATSLKLIRVSTRVWTIVGLGMDGLQGIVGTYDLIDKLSKIDPTLSEGARMAEAMMIVGNALLQLGIAIGGRLAAEGAARKQAIEAGVGAEANLNISRAPAELTRPLVEAGLKDVPVLVDKSIAGPEVKVKFSKDGYGMPTDIHIVAGAGATPEMIRLHIETVQLLQKYSGLGGWVRTLVDRISALVYSKQFVKPGSRGWNAQAEVIKIAKIIDHYTDEIAAGKVPKIDGEAYLDYLKQELRKHEQAINEVEEGSGFIAAQAPKSAVAQSRGYPEPPPGHYYIEESPGVFQLRAHVGFDGPPKMVVAKKTGKGWEIVDRPAETSVAAPGSAAAKADPKAARLDPAQLQLDVSKALNVSSSFVTILPESSTEVRLRPPAETGRGYELHVPANATSGAVESAVARHNDLARMRPTDLNSIPVDAKGKATWNGALEAEYRGRPTEDGYHWSLQNGKLQYVLEAAEEGAPARKKKVWDEKLGRAVEDKGAREVKSWPNDQVTTKAAAFDDLGGNNPKSPFGKWVELMEKLGFKRDDLIAALQDPSGLNYDTVRHNLKSKPVYQDAIKKWLTDPVEMRKRYPSEFEGIDPNDRAKQDAALRKAQHRAVLEIDQYLALKDATVWTEKWYIELFGKVPDEKGASVRKVESQVLFDKDKLNAANIDVAATRQADLIVVTEAPDPKNPQAAPVEKNILKDVKSHEGKIAATDKAQFDDYMRMVGKDVPRTDGTTTRIDSVTEVFLDPRGGKANAEWIAEQLATSSAKVSYEVFNTKGERRAFTQVDFQKLGSQQALQAAIIAFCNT
jgi:hypothetical protein